MAKRVTTGAVRNAPGAISFPSPMLELPIPCVQALLECRMGFHELCLETGSRVLQAMMEEDRTRLCGEPHRHQAKRTALRGGSTPSEVVLGGRKVKVARLRARSVEGSELLLPSIAWAKRCDPLSEHTLTAIAAGVSERGYQQSLAPLPASMVERSVTKSSVSRRFVALTTEQLAKGFSAPLGGLDIRVVMIDGIHFGDHAIVLALGIDSVGMKHPLGLREGATENARVATDLLSDLVDRGLATDRSLLFVIDGAKALRKAIVDCFGRLGLVQRCLVHKARNVLEYLPERIRPSVLSALHQAWSAKSAGLAGKLLEGLARKLEREHPGAAASIREGMDETLTLVGRSIDPVLLKTLRTTNPIENLNGQVARYTRNVKRWRGGEMILRWVGAAILDAESRFRRVKGYQAMKTLIAMLDANDRKLGVRRAERAA